MPSSLRISLIAKLLVLSCLLLDVFQIELTKLLEKQGAGKNLNLAALNAMARIGWHDFAALGVLACFDLMDRLS